MRAPRPVPGRAAARRGGVLCDEHGVPAIGRLTAVVAWFGRGQPVFDELLGVSANRGDATQVDHRAVPAAEQALVAVLEQAHRLVNDAKALEAAGAFSIVLEAVPAAVAAELLAAGAVAAVAVGRVPRRTDSHSPLCQVRGAGAGNQAALLSVMW